MRGHARGLPLGPVVSEKLSRVSVTYDPKENLLDVFVADRRVYSRLTRDPQAQMDDLLDAVTDALTRDLAPFLASMKGEDAP